MWPLLMAAALAWQPGPAETVRLPGATLAMGVVDPGPSALVLVLDGHRLLALQDGHIVARREVEATDLLVSDLDGDGREEVVLCGSDGLSSVPVAGRILGEPIVLDPTPCTSLASGSGGGWALVFTGPSGTKAIEGIDGRVQVVDLKLQMDGDVLLATTHDTVALGTPGGTMLILHQRSGGAVLPLGGPLVTLTALDGVLAWVQGEARNVVQLGGRRQEMPHPVDHLAQLSLPGGSELVAWSDERWVWPPWDLPTGKPLLADVDGDGCPDLLVGTDDGYVQAVGRCDLPRLAATDQAASSPEDAVTLPTVASQAATEGASGPPPVDEGDEPSRDPHSWPPAAWTQRERIPVDKLPAPPERLELGAGRPTVTAFVGQPVRIHLQPPSGQIEQIDGGPPGSRLESGAYVVEPEAWDIGRWAVATRGRPGEWYGFELEVWPRPAVGDPIPTSEPLPPPTAPPPPPRADADRWFHIDRCVVGAGLAGGASRSGGLAWEDLGSPSVQPSASPAVAALCDGGGVLRWVLGLDAAPWFRYTDLPTDRSHLIGATAGLQVGTDRFGIGPYGSAGVTAVNLGLRGQGFVSERVGVELRAGWLAPRAGMEAMALVLYRVTPKR